MNYNVINNENVKYIEFISSETKLSTEQDALDLIAVCFENEAGLIMLHGEVLSEDFFKLGTGVAGAILQKLVNYHIATAAIIPDEITSKGRFREMTLEANKSSHFRIFSSKVEAEKWLISVK